MTAWTRLKLPVSMTCYLLLVCFSKTGALATGPRLERSSFARRPPQVEVAARLGDAPRGSTLQRCRPSQPTQRAFMIELMPDLLDAVHGERVPVQRWKRRSVAT